jgi:hypothetical protein
MFVAKPHVTAKPETSLATSATPAPAVQPTPLGRPKSAVQPTPGIMEAAPVRPSRAAAVQRAGEPEILISPTESAALRQLIARASQGRIAAEFLEPAAEADAAVAPLPEIKPLDIEPVVPVNGEEGDRQ